MNTKITSALLIGFALIYSSCTRNIICVKGKGEQVTEVQTLSSFEEITLESSADIWLIHDPEASQAE